MHGPTTTQAPGSRLTSRPRRAVEASVLVAAWMAAGFLLPIDANGYLLLGIPLTVLFQLVVRRRPLRELYCRHAPRLTFDRAGPPLAAALAVVPGWYAVRAGHGAGWTMLGWYLAAVAGAVCAASALRATTVRRALRSSAIPMAVGSGAFAVGYGVAHLAAATPVPAVAALGALTRYSLLYFPATFVLEEVTFRGAMDAHVHHDGEHRGWLSATFVSALWGLWHLPVSRGLPIPLLVPELILVHIVLGVPLSLAWRRSGNLAGPALAHAVNDAVRNALMLGL